MLLDLHTGPKEEAGVLAAEATYGHSRVLPSQLQLPPHAPQAAPAKLDIPSTVKPTKKVEKAREVEVQEAGHVYVCEWVVIGPLDATYRSPYCVLVRERKKFLLEMGLCGTLEATRGIQDSSGSTATPTWPSGQVLGVRF